MRVSATVGRAERGAVAVMIAIMSLVLIVCIAFSVDLGYAWQVRRSMVKATDAAALAAAHEARDRARSGTQLAPGDCSLAPPVASAASDTLAANRSDAALDFCAIGTASGSEKGVVTVRGSTDAALSFSGVIGKNSIGVHSSTSVAWRQPKILPLAICADAVGNNDLAKWVEDPSSPTGDKELRASASANSRMCSSGGSGYWGALDLGKNVSGYNAFAECRNAYDFEATWLNLFNGTIGSAAPQIGQYFCGSVGTPSSFDYTRQVDTALCNLAKGTDVVVPIITEPPNSSNGGGSGKDWIARIGGYAVARFDGYSGIINKQNLCAPLVAVGPLGRHGRVHGRHRARRPRIELVRAAVRKGSIIPTKANVSSISPTSATVASGGSVTFTVTISNRSTTSIPTPTYRVDLPAGAAMISGCTAAGSAYQCTASGPIAPAGDITATFAASFTASGTVSANLLCSGLNGNVCNNSVDATPVTAVVTVQNGGGSGNKTLTLTTAGTGTGTVSFSNPAGKTCTASCTQAYSGNQNVVLTAAPTDASSYFAGWSGDCTGTGTCTVSTQSNPNVTATFNKQFTVSVGIAGTGTGIVSSSDGKITNCTAICVSTPYQTASVVTLTATATNLSTFSGWTGDCSGSTATCTLNLATIPNPVVQANFAANANGQQDFRQLTLNFSEVYRTNGTVITDITAYRICAIDVKTLSAALSACTKP